jgi:hypothetical protein
VGHRDAAATACKNIKSAKMSSAGRGSPSASPAARVSTRSQDSFKIAAQNTFHLDLDNLSACVNALKLCLLIHMSHALQEHETGRQDTRTYAHLEYFHNEIFGSCLNGENGIRFNINFCAKLAAFCGYNLQDCGRWNKEICALLKAEVGG